MVFLSDIFCSTVECFFDHLADPAAARVCKPVEVYSGYPADAAKIDGNLEEMLRRKGFTSFPGLLTTEKVRKGLNTFLLVRFSNWRDGPNGQYDKVQKAVDEIMRLLCIDVPKEKKPGEWPLDFWVVFQVYMTTKKCYMLPYRVSTHKECLDMVPFFPETFGDVNALGPLEGRGPLYEVRHHVMNKAYTMVEAPPTDDGCQFKSSSKILLFYVHATADKKFGPAILKWFAEDWAAAFYCVDKQDRALAKLVFERTEPFLTVSLIGRDHFPACEEDSSDDEPGVDEFVDVREPDQVPPPGKRPKTGPF
jgi:hypothetical protein